MQCIYIYLFTLHDCITFNHFWFVDALYPSLWGSRLFSGLTADPNSLGSGTDDTLWGTIISQRYKPMHTLIYTCSPIGLGMRKKDPGIPSFRHHQAFCNGYRKIKSLSTRIRNRKHASLKEAGSIYFHAFFVTDINSYL